MNELTYQRYSIDEVCDLMDKDHKLWDKIALHIGNKDHSDMKQGMSQHIYVEAIIESLSRYDINIFQIDGQNKDVMQELIKHVTVFERI